MNLEQKVMEQLKVAMKLKDKTALEALRAIKSAILLEKTKGGNRELTTTDEMKLLQKMVKQRRESAEIFQRQNRDDMAKSELAQVSVIERFLPKQMEHSEIVAVVEGIIEQTGATSMKDMGKVMTIANKEMTGKADGKLIAQIVKEKLS